MTPSPSPPLQSQLSHSLQSAMGSLDMAHSFTPSQLQNAVTAAALGSRQGKHAAARLLQQGAKVSGRIGSGASSNQGNVTTWRKQSGSNAGMKHRDAQFRLHVRLKVWPRESAELQYFTLVKY